MIAESNRLIQFDRALHNLNLKYKADTLFK